MKTLFVVIILFLTIAQSYACDRAVDPKKIVLMLSFNNAAEEAKGASAAACSRGEKLIILPKLSPEFKALATELNRLNQRWAYEYQACRSQACMDRVSSDDHPTYKAILNQEVRMKPFKPSLEKQLAALMEKSKDSNAKVTSLILSGHDGGGSFYGDFGKTDIAEIGNLVADNKETFNSMSSLLLMGCWSAVPDQIDQWKTIFPKVELIGGFVGSAPASTRVSSGTFIADLLRGEKRINPNSTRLDIKTIISGVRNINNMTSAVYVNATQCIDQEKGYYYISPAQTDSELPEEYRPGFAPYVPTSSQKQACENMFGTVTNSNQGSYNWTRLMRYYSGAAEPENNDELRSLYSSLRNMEYCFSQGFSKAVITPDQVLFLRFFQDTKKNFNKYFSKDLEELYTNLNVLVDESMDPALKLNFQGHIPLKGDGLVKMTRKQTLDQISKLQGIFDKVASAKPDAAALPQIRSAMEKLDKYLYRMKCLPPTWHEFVQGEQLEDPQC